MKTTQKYQIKNTSTNNNIMKVNKRSNNELIKSAYILSTIKYI
jgi:hypothetical protein